jgi:nitrite reductase/ring-hydroxylating ferredoxin subunit/uncharacterized membrane protein
MLERMGRPLRGFGNGTAGVVGAVFRGLGGPGRLLQDFLNGTWLGHSLHAVLVDVVIGAATGALLLDVLRTFFAVEGLETAATWIVGLAWLSGIGSLVTGLTEFKDTDPNTTTRDVTILHGLVNFVGMGGLAFSTMQRLNDNHDAGFWGLLIGYLVIGVGGYIGGHLVFKYGYSVNRNAFSRGKRAKEFTAVLPAAELPEDTPTKASLGATGVVLVRRGDVVHALKETCSHAGGPLSGGKLRDGTIECPWHASVFRLADGSVVHGPATSRQVAYRARINGDQVEIEGPHD